MPIHSLFNVCSYWVLKTNSIKIQQQILNCHLDMVK
uniref:Uncharacterized protein n=1 Tax=Rhizophora mucronata TaxID=61149 RepID=A0A2P2PN43_RHIMU